MATWLDWCIKAPGPPEKAGYTAQADRALGEILYIVNHSAEGWKSFLIQGHRPGANASWSFSNNQDGSMYQHYPLEAITYTSGGFRQNVDGLGVEHEGVAGQPLNGAQVANDRRLFESLQAICSNLGAPVFPGGFREHSELTNGATTCPSGRIQNLYSSYKEDEVDENTKVDWIGDGRKRTLAEMFQHHMRRNDNREAEIKALKAETAKTQTSAGDGAHKHIKED